MPFSDSDANLTAPLIFFGLGLGLVLAASILAGRERSPVRYLLVGLFASFAFALLPAFFHDIGDVWSRGALHLGRTAHFTMGPLALLYGRALNARAPGGRDWLHFLPALLVFCLAWIVLPPSTYPGDSEDHVAWLIANPTSWIAHFHIALYLWLALRALLAWSSPFPGARRGLVVVIALYLTGMSLSLAGMLLEAHHRLAHLVVAGLVPVMALHFLLIMRYPVLRGARIDGEFARENSIKSDGGPRDDRGERSTAPGPARLKAGTARRMQIELERLMSDERLYLDEDLTLARLARALGLSSHQLSWLLNDHLGENFYGLVNRYRVEAACDMLREEPDRTTLSIAMAVGFNSRSSFNTAFKKLTGQSPAEYRRKI